MLEWAGLQAPEEPSADPATWTPVVKDLPVDDSKTGSCEEASRVTAVLGAAGIEAQRHAYVLQDDISIGRSGFRLLGPGPAPADRIRVAVLVQARDLQRARDLLAADVTNPGSQANQE